MDKVKSEAMGSLKHKDAETREVDEQIKFRDQRSIEAAQSLNGSIAKSALNKLGLSSHRKGAARANEGYATITDSLDAGTVKVIKIKDRQSGIIAFKEMDFLKSSDSIEWVVLSEEDYTTQLIYGLSKSVLPKKVVKTGPKVFLDPVQFIRLVKAQEEMNDVDLTLSFDRASARRGNLEIKIQNMRNFDKDRGLATTDTGNESWRERERRGAGGPVTTMMNPGSKKL